MFPSTGHLPIWPRKGVTGCLTHARSVDLLNFQTRSSIDEAEALRVFSDEICDGDSGVGCRRTRVVVVCRGGVGPQLQRQAATT